MLEVTGSSSSLKRRALVKTTPPFVYLLTALDHSSVGFVCACMLFSPTACVRWYHANIWPILAKHRACSNISDKGEYRVATSIFPGEKPDRLEEECAVFGVYSTTDDVARLTCFGLQALQHRGQESAGIAVPRCSMKARWLRCAAKLLWAIAVTPRVAAWATGQAPSPICRPSTRCSSRLRTMARL